MEQEKKLTGYPSIDKPWLKYYSEEEINAALPECTIYEYLWENNKDHLDDIALICFGKKITYKKLFENIDKAAKAFLSLGIKEGDIVTVCAVTVPETVYAYYGLNKIGAISNMIDPRTSIDGIQRYIEEVSSKTVVCIDAALKKIITAVKNTEVKEVIVISPADSLPNPQKIIYKIIKSPKMPKEKMIISWHLFIKSGIDVQLKNIKYKKDSCCVIVHTGGTTGDPKGVMLSNDNLNKSAFQMLQYNLQLEQKHRWLNIMPPFIVYGIGNGLHNPLSVGMEVVLIPLFNPKKFDEILLKHKPNHMVGVPSHYENIISSKKLSKKDLSFIIAPTVGGDSMNTELENEVNDFLKQHNSQWKIIKGYGMTEVSAGVCVCSADCNKIGSVGIPFSHVTISVFDENSGKELSYNQEGEICITGTNTMLGYYNNAKATNNIIKTHDDGLPWVHSGDIGYIDEDGFVFIKGRIKRMIIRHDGFKIFPSLIENIVKKNRSVNACCAVGVADKEHCQGKLPVVFFESSDKNIDTVKHSLAELCRNYLPEYAQPVNFIYIDKLPLTGIGKVDYRALEELSKDK